MWVLESQRAKDGTPAGKSAHLAIERRDSIARTVGFGLVIIGALVLYVLSLHLYQIGSGVDDGYYIVTAQSLAAGKGYVLGTIVGSPPMLRLPPGFPLLLSVVARIAPHSLAAFRIPSLLLTLGAFPLWFTLLRQRVGYAWATLAMVAVAVNQFVLGSATSAMSEAMTFFLIPLLIVLVEAALDQRNLKSRGRSLGLTLAIILTLVALHFARSVMIVFVASTFVYLVLNRQVRRALVIAILAGVPFVAWMGYSLNLLPTVVTGANSVSTTGVTSTNSSVAPVFMASSYGSAIVGGNEQQLAATFSGKLTAFLNRRWSLVAIFLPDSLGLDFVPFGAPRLTTRLLLLLHLDWLPSIVTWSTGLVVVLGLIVGLVVRRRAGGEFAELATLFYFLGLSVWPYPSSRFFEPVVPMLYLGLILGVVAIVGRPQFGARKQTLTRIAVAVALAVVFAANFRNDVVQLRQPPRLNLPDLSVGSAWLADHAPANAIVASDDAVLHSLYVRQDLWPIPSGHLTDDAYLAALRQVHASYVLIAPWLNNSRFDPHFSPATQYLQKVIAAHPDQFQLVYSNTADRVEIYRFQPR